MAAKAVTAEEPEEPQAPAEAAEPKTVEYTPDQAALVASKGDPAVWAAEMAKMLAAVSGVSYDAASTLQPWFESFSHQVSLRADWLTAIGIANMQVDADLAGDIAFELLDFRDEIARGIRARTSK
jgi:hypothetical protein